MVKRLRNHRSGGTSGMRDEHLKGWLEGKQKEEAVAEKLEDTEETKVILGGIRWGGGGEKVEYACGDE